MFLLLPWLCAALPLIQGSGLGGVGGIKRETVSSPHWQLILQDALYSSLARFTGFTESLDERIERDRLLWGLIREARFLRKAEPSGPELAGTLLDATRDTGSYELHTAPVSVYNCSQTPCLPSNLPILALWKMVAYSPSNLRIYVKTPFGKMEEDVYDYSPKFGLQKSGKSFQEPFLYNGEQQNGFRRQSFYIPKGFYLTTPVEDLLYSKGSFQKVLQEFKGERYEGFLPSLGPVAPAYTPQEYTTNPAVYIASTRRPKVGGFRASPEFVQYSEADPFYQTQGVLEVEQNSSPTTSQEEEVALMQYSSSLQEAVTSGHTTEAPTVASIKQYPHSINDQLPELADVETTTTPKPRRFPKEKYKPRPSRIKTLRRPLDQAQIEKTNIAIENVTDKAPEEVVALLTTAGLQEEPRAEQSLVVNRVSKSYSMRTARSYRVLSHPSSS